jgi:hypothetical protein
MNGDGANARLLFGESDSRISVFSCEKLGCESRSLRQTAVNLAQFATKGVTANANYLAVNQAFEPSLVTRSGLDGLPVFAKQYDAVCNEIDDPDLCACALEGLLASFPLLSNVSVVFPTFVIQKDK